MTIEEVLRALADGKIVRADDGHCIFYVGLKDGTVVYNDDPHNLSTTSFSFSALYTYSIYEPPKAKKRYWQWKLQGRTWFRHSQYMDDDGLCSDGTQYFTDGEWNKMKKIKIEDDYVEV